MDALTVAKLWILVKPWKRLRQWRTRRKMRSWLEYHADETAETFNSEPTEVRMTLMGVLKSKTIWFGLLLSISGAAGLFLQTDVVPLVHSDPLALLVIGLIVKVLRVLTTQPLSAK